MQVGRTIGEGSYGRVRLGAWRQTEVAVKQLNSQGAAGFGLLGATAGGAAEGEVEVQWNEQVLADLRKEVDMLVTLRVSAAAMRACRHERSQPRRAGWACRGLLVAPS